MRDIAHKPTTLRTAIAEARLVMEPTSVIAIRDNQGPKPDILPTARAAAYLAVKNTASAIPHCHPIPVEAVRVDFEFREREVRIELEAKTIYKTGVEIEAMHGVGVAALTIYDMMKPIEPTIEIAGIRLVQKKGGKSDLPRQTKRRIRACLITFSELVLRGEKVNRARDIAVASLERAGIQVAEEKVIPEEEAVLKATIESALEQEYDLVMTIGGTGVNPGDVCPEVIGEFIQQPVPGIMEAARAYGQERSPKAMISRGVAGLHGKTLLLTLPGSSAGAQESIDALFPGLIPLLETVQRGHC